MSLNIAIVSPTRPTSPLQIQADLTWTVAQLKQAITDEHPLHPTPLLQRLVHQGRLLNDAQNIMDVLNGDAQGNVLVHLVISSGGLASNQAPPAAVLPVLGIPGHIAQGAPIVAPPAAPVAIPRAQDDDEGNENRPRDLWTWFQVVAKLVLFVALIGHGLSPLRLAMLSFVVAFVFLFQHGFIFARRAVPARAAPVPAPAPAAAAAVPANEPAPPAAPASVLGALFTVSWRLITSLIPSENDVEA
eukprot:m.56232 g.56232  ORF g.56232 m.56232 type:complete len:245 (+) comp12022_c0_seq1:106-840(+)